MLKIEPGNKFFFFFFFFFFLGMNSYTKFEENGSINAQGNRSINAQDRARKQNFNVNQGP